MSPAHGLFVTGTDTGVGKTVVSAALVHAYVRLGYRVVGMKPVAAGAERQGSVWVNEDVACLRAESNVDAPQDWVNPYLFREAMAPHIAAERKGVTIEIPRIRAAYEGLASLAEVVVVEGVGGFRVPLSAQRDTSDLAVALNLPVVLVVGIRLGCISHALLSSEVIVARGLKLAGWVANRLSPGMPAQDENIDALRLRLQAPLLAELPCASNASTRSVADCFSPKRLQGLLHCF